MRRYLWILWAAWLGGLAWAQPPSPNPPSQASLSTQPIQCYLSTTITVERPGWFSSKKEVMRPMVATMMGRQAAISVDQGWRPRAADMLTDRPDAPAIDRVLLEMTPQWQSNGGVRLLAALAVNKPGLPERKIQTSSILEEGQPWEFSLFEEGSETRLHCKVSGWWTVPAGHEFGGVDEQRRPIWKPSRAK